MLRKDFISMKDKQSVSKKIIIGKTIFDILATCGVIAMVKIILVVIILVVIILAVIILVVIILVTFWFAKH